MACKVSEFVNLSKGPIESSSSFSVIPRANDCPPQVRGVPGLCRTQIRCAMNVPWCGWGEGWQALQVGDYKAPRTSDDGLKIRVSARGPVVGRNTAICL